MTTSTHISKTISGLTRLGWLIYLVSWSGCATKPTAVVIPDSHELRPAWDCPIDGVQCVPDPYRVTIDAGYLRNILRTLEGCTQ